MKIGDFIRTKNNGIRKILDIGEYLGMKQYLIDENGTYVIDNSIIKSSPNIIDLIEVGDYVNERIVEWVVDDFIAFGKLDYAYEKDIKSIVTKEQFESMEYEVK